MQHTRLQAQDGDNTEFYICGRVCKHCKHKEYHHLEKVCENIKCGRNIDDPNGCYVASQKRNSYNKIRFFRHEVDEEEKVVEVAAVPWYISGVD